MRMGQGSILALLGLVGVLGGCAPDAGDGADPPRVVDVARVKPANGAEDVVLSGRVTAAEHTRLSFEIAGKIERLSVDVGDAFSKGDVLAALDDTRYRLVEERAAASEREARAALHEARLAFERQKQLREKGFVSEAALDNARAKLDTARSRHESARASHRLARRDLRLTDLKAPFDGSVSERRVEPSERVSPGQPVLGVISQREGFEVETSVSETLVERLIIHSNHWVVVPSLKAKRLPAKVSHIGSQPRSSNNYPVILKLRDTPPGLRSGMTARVRLALAESPGGDVSQEPVAAVRVPLTALVYDGPSRAHVLRLAADQRLETVAVAVTVRAVHEGLATVTGELEAGQRIVARGAEFVRAGQKVTALDQGAQRYN